MRSYTLIASGIFGICYLAWLAWQSFEKGQTVLGVIFCASAAGIAIGIPSAVRFDRQQR